MIKAHIIKDFILINNQLHLIKIIKDLFILRSMIKIIKLQLLLNIINLQR